MSGDNRKKKDGERKEKKNERMREDIRERREHGEANAAGREHHPDTGDVNPKPNSETQEGQTARGAIGS